MNDWAMACTFFVACPTTGVEAMGPRSHAAPRPRSIFDFATAKVKVASNGCTTFGTMVEGERETWCECAAGDGAEEQTAIAPGCYACLAICRGVHGGHRFTVAKDRG